VSGIASKGLLRNAQVVAYRVEGGNRVEIGRTTTTGTGSYELTNLPLGALVIVTITATAGTQMVDEATDTLIDVPAGFEMRAATVLQSTSIGGANKLHVTPFSEMAVAKAESASGGLTQASVQAANEDIGRYLHFDPLTLAPEFAAAGSVEGATPTNAPALMLAAVSQLAASSSLGCASGNQADRVKCVVQTLAAGGTHDAAISTALNAARQTTVTDEGYQGTFTPPDVQVQPEVLITPEYKTGIQSAKDLIDSVRDNARALEDLGHRLDGVQTAMLEALKPVTSERVAIIQALALATERLDSYRQGRYTGALPLPASALIEPRLRGSMDVGCTVYADADFSVEATTYENADHVACAITYADVSVSGQRFLSQQRFTVSPRAGVSSGRGYTATAILVKQQTALNAAWPTDPVNWIGDAQLLSDPYEVQITATGTGMDLTHLSLQGNLPQVVREDGSIGGETLSLNVALSVAPLEGNGNLSKLSITGLLSAVSAATDEELATVGLTSGSYVIARLAVPGQVNSEVVDNADTEGHFVLQASVPGGSQVSGELTVSDFAPSTRGDDWPTKLVFVGDIKETAGTPLFSGSLTLIATDLSDFYPDLFGGNETADNFLPKTVAFQGTLHLQDAPPLQLDVNLNNTTFGMVAGLGSYQQGNRTINVQSSNNQQTGLWTLALSGPGGVSVSLSKTSTTAQVTANGGVVVGVLNRDTGRIDYADGTFESF
jgi:hypothetical protein